MDKMRNINWRKLLKYFGSGIFVVLLIYRIDFIKVFHILLQVRLEIYFLVFIIFLLNKLIASYRWQLLLRAQNINIKLTNLYKLYLFGFIFNFALPSNIGGDAVKLYQLFKKHPDRKAGSVAATLLDRLLGLLALFFLVMLTILFNDLVSLKLRLLFFLPLVFY